MLKIIKKEIEFFATHILDHKFIVSIETKTFIEQNHKIVDIVKLSFRSDLTL